MSLRHKLFSQNTVLAAADLTNVANNGVVQIATTADLDNADLANVNVVYVVSETKLRVRKSAGLGIAHWSNPFDSVTPEYAATVSHTGYGQWTVTNYNTEFFYDATTTAGNVAVADSGTTCVITNSAATTATINLNERTSLDGEPQVTVMYRQPYTYYSQYSCWEVTYGGSNCRTDVNPHTWDCPGGTAGGGQWGDCVCKRTDCGYSNVKNATPSGWNDDNGEWWK